MKKLIKKIIPVCIKQTLKDLSIDIKEYNLNVAMTRVLFNLTGNEIKLQKAITGYLYDNYKELLSESRYTQYEESEDVLFDKEPIWFFWWQGEKNMPLIIQLCYKSRIKYANGHPVILITKDNIKKYVTLSPEVLKQFDSGKLRIQHLADILRINLIEKHGGLWLDASIFSSQIIPESYFHMPVYTINHHINCDTNVSQGKWTTFAIGGTAHNMLCMYLKEFFNTYCSNGKKFIHYFMFDHAILLAYENMITVKKDVDAILLEERDIYWLNEHLLDEFSLEKIEEYKKNIPVFSKIAWNNEKYMESDYKNSLLNYLLMELDV